MQGAEKTTQGKRSAVRDEFVEAAAIMEHGFPIAVKVVQSLSTGKSVTALRD